MSHTCFAKLNLFVEIFPQYGRLGANYFFWVIQGGHREPFWARTCLRAGTFPIDCWQYLFS